MKLYLEKMFGADLRALASLRVGLALLILYDIWDRCRDLSAHYADFGVFPRSDAIRTEYSRWLLSLHFINGTWQFQALLFGIAALFAISLLVGYRTRLATIVSWVLLVSLHNRNPYVSGGADVMLRSLVFWTIFLPLGARFSLDNLWRRGSEEPPPVVMTWATFAYCLQFVYIYWFSVILKSSPEWRSDGTALYYALQLDYMASGLAQVLVEFPKFLKLATFGTMWLELLGPLLLIAPFFSSTLRLVGIMGFFLLHLGIFLTLRIGIFPVVNMIALLFFVPSSCWDRLAFDDNLQARLPLKVFYDEGCRVCWRVVRLIQSLVGLRPESLIAIDGSVSRQNSHCSHGWAVEQDGQERSYEWKALLVAAAASPIVSWLVPVMRFPLLRSVGAKCCRHDAKPQRLGSNIEYEIHGLKLARITNIGIAAMLVYVGLWNITTIKDAPLQLGERTRALGYILRMDQKWSLFAPHPPKSDGWLVIPGTLRNGSTIDLVSNGKPVDWKKPASVHDTYKNHRWWKFIELLLRYKHLAPLYARYLCRDWNSRHSDHQRLTELEIIYLWEKIRLDVDYSPVEKDIVFKHSCSVEEQPGSLNQDGNM